MHTENRFLVTFRDHNIRPIVDQTSFREGEQVDNLSAHARAKLRRIQVTRVFKMELQNI